MGEKYYEVSGKGLFGVHEIISEEEFNERKADIKKAGLRYERFDERELHSRESDLRHESGRHQRLNLDSQLCGILDRKD
jgi:hypothetical protein